MIPWPNFRYVDIGPFNIYMWGVFVAIGFLVAYYLMYKNAKKPLEKKTVEELAFWSLVGLIIGSRLLYVIVNYPYYADNLLEIFMIWEGGLVSYGGVIGALLAVFIYCKKKKVNFIRYVDFMIPYVALGMAIGRIGCFFNGCCYGIETTLPWGVDFGDGVLRHPTQLYLALGDLSIFFILKNIKKRFNGFFILSFAALYSVLRFSVDFLRDYENVYYFHSLKASQWIMIAVFAISIIVIFIKLRKRK